MIDKETLISFAKLNGIRPWQQEKHYIQTVILTAMAEEQVIFKGGTYLWFFHGLNRFSEDVDFTSTRELPPDFEKKISNSLKLIGIENQVKIFTNDERGFSFRISAKGPLNTSDIDLCHVDVEISKRENILRVPVSLKLDMPAYKLPTKMIGGMALEEVSAEKIWAILTRQKARDVYDLLFLIEKKGIKFDINLVNEKMKPSEETLQHTQVHQKKVNLVPNVRSVEHLGAGGVSFIRSSIPKLGRRCKQRGIRPNLGMKTKDAQ